MRKLPFVHYNKNGTSYYLGLGYAVFELKLAIKLE